MQEEGSEHVGSGSEMGDVVVQPSSFTMLHEKALSQQVRANGAYLPAGEAAKESEGFLAGSWG